MNDRSLVSELELLNTEINSKAELMGEFESSIIKFMQENNLKSIKIEDMELSI